MYLKIKTTEKEKVLSLLEEILEKEKLHRIITQKGKNEEYLVEIIEMEEEPEIISS